MKDIDQIRRENMLLLEKERGGPTSAAKVASMTLSQWTNLRKGAKDSKTGEQRGMRKTTARKIEESFNKPSFWLDIEHEYSDWYYDYDHSELSPSYNLNERFEVPYLPDVIAHEQDGSILIVEFKTGGSMGKGVVLRDQPGVIQSWTVSKEWLNKNVKSHTSSDNLCIVTGFGDSMRGMFEPGDPLIVDTGVKSVDYDGVYFFRVGEEGFIKRLQRIPGEGIRAISANKEYETWTIRPEMDFEVFGRILKAWESSDY